MTTTKYLVRCVCDTSASVPGGWIESRHDTLAEAEAAKARLDALEAIRRAKPRRSKAEARRIAVKHYGEPGNNLHLQGVIAETVRGLRHCRTTEYVVLQVDGSSEQARGYEPKVIHA